MVPATCMVPGAVLFVGHLPIVVMLLADDKDMPKHEHRRWLAVLVGNSSTLCTVDKLELCARWNVVCVPGRWP
jgi:hypothetical protein